MNDKELTGLLKNDPQKGFEAVIRQYSAYVMKIARTRLDRVCAREDIEETVSDVFFKFYCAGKERGFEIPSVKGFLAVIAQRHCTDVFRRMSKSVETLDYSELENIIADAQSSGDEERLAEALKQLGEPDCNISMSKSTEGSDMPDFDTEQEKLDYIKENWDNEKVTHETLEAEGEKLFSLDRIANVVIDDVVYTIELNG